MIRMTTIVLLLLMTAACSKKSSTATSSASSGTTPDTTKTFLPTATAAKRMVIADQSTNRVIIVEPDSNTIVWEWQPATSNVRSQDLAWFGNMSDARPVYNNQYILATASAGGVALVRIADKKTVFYGYSGNGNTHSAEILPDGNIVTASSTGAYLALFHVDTLHSPATAPLRKITLNDAHNVVWDSVRQRLWSASGGTLYAFSYNFQCTSPGLTLIDSLALPATGSHDLYPVYGRDSLWLSTSSKVWSIDLKKRTVAAAASLARVKSVSSGPAGYPTIVLQSIDTDQQWWNNKIITFSGDVIFLQTGLKAYKARWMLTSNFGQSGGNTVKTCQ